MKRKDKILLAARQLFAAQGFSGTTTLQIAEAAGVTEPLIYYHYKGKDGLFSQILSRVLSDYIGRLEKIDAAPSAPIDKICDLIHQHVAIVDDMPDGVRLMIRSCPARLHDPEGICRRIYLNARAMLKQITADCLRKGIADQSVAPVAVDATANTLVALMNGLMRQKIGALDSFEGVESAAVAFVRRGLSA
jgi:AcrR family transcriptional regulator